MVDSLLVALLVVLVALSAYKVGKLQQQVDCAEDLALQQQRRAEQAEQRLADVLAIPLPKGYGEAIGAKPRPQNPYEQEQAAILRANYNND